MLPVMLRQRYEYLEYILECVKSDSMKGNLTADIFSEKNQSGLKTEVRELSALFAEIRTSSLERTHQKKQTWIIRTGFVQKTGTRFLRQLQSQI